MSKRKILSLWDEMVKDGRNGLPLLNSSLRIFTSLGLSLPDEVGEGK